MDGLISSIIAAFAERVEVDATRSSLREGPTETSLEAETQPVLANSFSTLGTQLHTETSQETKLNARHATTTRPSLVGANGAGTSASRSRFPWTRLNLKRNPFGELTEDERAELAVFAEGDLSRCDVVAGQAVQLIGDCGRGKTTRMLAIRRALPEASYVYLPEKKPCPAIPFGSPLLIDEAQRLPRRIRRNVFSTGLPLVLATHDNLERVLRRFGYAVRSIWIGNENTPELIGRLLNLRIEASRLGAGPLPEVNPKQVEQLVDRFGTNVRAIEHFLYERFQSAVSQDPVTQDPVTQHPLNLD